MRWRSGRRSENIEDLRSAPNASGNGLGMGGIGLLIRVIPFLLRTGMGRGLLVVAVLAYFGLKMVGVDLLQLTSSLPSSSSSMRAPSGPLSEADREMGEFVSVILADTEDTWSQLFNQSGQTYQKPKLVLFRNGVKSACGFAQSAVGPFYCPGDQKLYIDLSFYEDMKHKLGAPGDFAQAYVIAHEIGHHIQTLLGTSAKVTQAQQKLSEAEANKLSVMLELQADCYAGVWGHHADSQRGLIEAGDIDEALVAAQAIGDDTLQRNATGQVRPESFTHGTSEQRKKWFQKGMATGDVNQCNTFNQPI